MKKYILKTQVSFCIFIKCVFILFAQKLLVDIPEWLSDWLQKCVKEDWIPKNSFLDIYK